MTRGSILEYIEAIRGRYLSVSRKEKGRILDEFTSVTSLHRKAATRLLRRRGRVKVKRKLGRPCGYGTDVVSALRVVWETTDRLCSKRLHPFLPEVLVSLKRLGEITLTPEVETQLYQISPSSIDRLLHPYRRPGGRRPFATTKRGSLSFARRRGPREISYKLRRASWGQGFATEAIRAALQWFFSAIDEAEVSAVTQAANKRSCRLLEWLGGHLTEAFTYKDAPVLRYTFGHWYVADA